MNIPHFCIHSLLPQFPLADKRQQQPLSAEIFFSFRLPAPRAKHTSILFPYPMEALPMQMELSAQGTTYLGSDLIVKSTLLEVYSLEDGAVRGPGTSTTLSLKNRMAKCSKSCPFPKPHSSAAQLAWGDQERGGPRGTASLSISFPHTYSQVSFLSSCHCQPEAGQNRVFLWPPVGHWG